MNGVRNYQYLYILCPVFYEHENIEKLWTELTLNIDIPFKIFFIYDHPDDPTLEVINDIRRKIQNKDQQISVIHNQQGGVLEALKLGFTLPPNDAPVLVLMADLSDDLSLIRSMVEAWQKGATIVCPSRYMPGGKQIGAPKFKNFLSKIASKSLYWIGKSPVRDLTNNYKLYDSNFVRNIHIESRGGFEIAIELISKAIVQGKKVVEMPTIWKGRQKGASNFKMLSWLRHYLKWYFYLLSTRRVI